MVLHIGMKNGYIWLIWNNETISLSEIVVPEFLECYTQETRKKVKLALCHSSTKILKSSRFINEKKYYEMDD